MQHIIIFSLSQYFSMANIPTSVSLCHKQVFSWRGSYILSISHSWNTERSVLKLIRWKFSIKQRHKTKSCFHIDRFAHVCKYLHICKYTHLSKSAHVNGFAHICKICTIIQSLEICIYAHLHICKSVHVNGNQNTWLLVHLCPIKVEMLLFQDCF